MSNPDVTDPPKTPTASTPASGSVTPQRVGDDWMEYLDSTGNISRYDGMCDCYVCRQIKADYFPWKARKEEAKSLNAEVSGGASGRAARECGTDRANAGWLQRLVRPTTTTMKSKIRQRREAKALCPRCQSAGWKYTGRTPGLGESGKHNFECTSCGNHWQYGKSESIYTQLA